MAEQSRLRIGLLQSRIEWRDPSRNHAFLAGLLEQRVDADIAVLPETFTTGFLGDSEETEEGMDGPTVRWMREWAARHDCVLTGSAVMRAAHGRVNRLLWVEPDGRLQHYDKRHLFSQAGEGRRYAAGSERVVIDYRGWRICPQICYDLRFPVWCRNRGDYDLLLVVANWPAPRIDAWSTLLKARAIENQCYVVAVNRVGRDGRGNEYPGRSVVHGPLGEVLTELGGQEGYTEVEVNLDVVREVRATLPFQADADPFALGPA